MQLSILSLIVQIIALVLGLYFLRRLSLPFVLIVAQIGLAVICEITGIYLAKTSGANLWLFNFYMIAEVILLCYAGALFITNRVYRKFLIAGIFGLACYWSVHIAKHGVNVLANTFYLAGCVLIVCTYLAVMFSRATFENVGLSKQPSFWLSLSILIFFGGYLPYKGIENYLIYNSPTTAQKLFLNINIGLNLLRYPLLAYSFYLSGKSRASHALLPITH